MYFSSSSSRAGSGSYFDVTGIFSICTSTELELKVKDIFENLWKSVPLFKIYFPFTLEKKVKFWEEIKEEKHEIYLKTRHNYKTEDYKLHHKKYVLSLEDLNIISIFFLIKCI